MPTYQYACRDCGHRFEAVQSFSDASLTDCPQCSGGLRKVFSSVGIVFKGSGFYRTDSRAGAVKGESSSGGSSDAGGSGSGSSGSGSSGSDSGSSSSGSSGSGGSGSSGSGGSGSSGAGSSSTPAASAAS